MFQEASTEENEDEKDRNFQILFIEKRHILDDGCTILAEIVMEFIFIMVIFI